MKSLILFAVGVIACTTASAADWQPGRGPLMTRWAKDVSPDNVLPEYPRPQMVRERWQNLNGLWQYAVAPRNAERPDFPDGQKILVPFAIESALSGVMQRVGADQQLWYRRMFDVPKAWNGQRVLLHFGAVDWDCSVWVNGKKVGDHRGGYDPFSFDITEALHAERSTSNELVVRVWDPTDAGTQARGKQVAKPHGIWYTPVTGIWQTVWVEPVPKAYIQSLKITPDVDAGAFQVEAECVGVGPEHRLSITLTDPSTRTKTPDGETVVIEGGADGRHNETIPLQVIGDPKLWSPNRPHLYEVDVALGRRVGDRFPIDDQVTAYAGLRKIELKKDDSGVNRLFLNGEPLFQYGPLDQGWWPDGLYTAPTDAALKYDIEVTKRLGFNMARKHVKVEPARWYYWCDKLGLLVWQDMPSGFGGEVKHVQRGAAEDTERDTESAKQFEGELLAMIDAFRNHPCIVMWVPFNEGWGQYDTARITELVKKHDPTRLVDNPSGWEDRGVGDVHDIHVYPGPGMPPLEDDRAAVLGEFGGLGLPLEGHTWQDKQNWGYRSFKTKEALTEAYIDLLEKMRPMIGRGLAAAIYTQTSDVEIEVNGLMTYDRAVIKMDEKRITAAAEKLYLPPPVVKTVVPTSQKTPQQWRYTTKKPAEGWTAADFDDSDWQIARGGFGEPSTPGSAVHTEWKTPNIWIRREFTLETVPENPHLLLHHDEDAEVYLNGELAATVKGYVVDYFPRSISASATKTLKTGRNVMAVHCHQTGGGQYIDVGLINIHERER